MMEQVEDTFVVGAIGWLAQTILASLFAGKLEAWIRELGLADDIEKLKSEIEIVDMVAATVKGREVGNRPLVRSLARLKELLYDADDAIDELDYYRWLKQQVEGGTCGDPDGMDGHGAEQLERSRGDADMPSSSGAWKPRSEAWEHFEVKKDDLDGKGKPVKAKCIHCRTEVKCGSKGGTSVLHNHLKSANCTGKRGASAQQPNPSSTTDGAAHGTPVAIGDSGSRKRMRMDEVSTHVTADNTHPWNKAEFSNRIQQIARQLQHIGGAVSEVLELCGSSSVPSSNHHWSTSSSRHLRTSSPIQRKMYGRFAEKDKIIKLMEAGKSDSITVLPIVGTGGIGKTALARFAYNCSDPRVENQFDHRIWVSVTDKFDEVRLTREMLDFASQERHEGISSFAKLQEILKKCMELKRFLLILDDVWDGVHDYQWDELLAPFKSNHTKGSVVLVTTRNLSVAKRMGTVGPIKLGAMEHDDFLLLLQACAFGDNKYEGHQSLSTIGQKIAKKLDGNPLAAETAGKLLKEHLNIDHWNTILKNEAWKSLEISRGIISVLKISLDHLPYHLQQCFLYCSIFPNSYPFSGEELIQIWISQGFVYHRHSSKTTEDIGQDYLVDLVNSGFFTPEKGEWDFTVTKDERYVIPGLMRDLARKVSRTECANIDGRECNDMEPTIRHLSIGSGFACHGDEGENNEYFEKNMLKAAESIKKLRTLVLFGRYGSNFFQSFQHMFKEARNLRLLIISARYADFNPFLCNLVNLTHIRYLKLEGEEDNEALPDAGKLQILLSLERLPFLKRLELRNMRNITEVSIPSLDELVLDKMPILERCSCTSVRDLNSSLRILKITRCTVLKVFPLFESSQKFRIEQKSWLSNLRELIIHECPQLEVSHPLPPSTSVSTLSIWRVSTLPTMKGLSNEALIIGVRKPDGTIDESSDELRTLDGKMLSFHNLRFLTKLEVDGCRNLTSISLEGFGQLISLKIFEISNCKNLFSPHVLPEGTHEDMAVVYCKALPSLECLRIESCGITGKWLSLMLRHVQALQELYLTDCQEITTWLSVEENSQSNLISAPEASSSGCPDDTSSRSAPEGLLRIPLNLIPSLKKISIIECQYLTFGGSKDGLAGFTSLEELTIRECRDLLSSLVHKDGNDDQANGRWLLPRSLVAFEVEGHYVETLQPCFPENLICLKKLIIRHSPNLKSLWLHCTALEELTIRDCALEGLQSLGGLRHLEVSSSCGLKSLQLHYYTALEELKLEGCKSLVLLEGLQSLVGLRRLEVYGSLSLKSLQLHCCTALEKLTIRDCGLRHLEVYESLYLTFCGSNDGLAGFTSLEELKIRGCPKLLSSWVHKDGNDDQANGRWLLPQSLVQLEFWGHHLEMRQPNLSKQVTLQPCFPGNLTCLKKLTVWHSPSLKSLRLHSCTALEELSIKRCESLAALEGLQSLGGLRHLEVYGCHGFPPCSESLSTQGLTSLETLRIDDPSVLTTLFCKHLISLQRLELLYDLNNNVKGLTDEQERALQLLTTLQDLRFHDLWKLEHLPVCLHSLPSLKRLEIIYCRRISRLPEKGLPPSLEELVISDCSKELTEQCRTLATIKLKVKTNGKYVN